MDKRKLIEVQGTDASTRAWRRAILRKRFTANMCLAGCHESRPCPNEWDREDPAPRSKHTAVVVHTCDRCHLVDLLNDMHTAPDDSPFEFLCEDCAKVPEGQ